MKSNRTEKSYFLRSSPLLLAALFACTSAPKAPGEENTAGPDRVPAAEAGDGIQVAISLQPVQVQNVCQYEGQHRQNAKSCGAVRKIGAEYPSFQPAVLKQWATEINNAYGRKAAELMSGDTGTTVNKDNRLRRLTHSKTIACAVGRLDIQVPEDEGFAPYRQGLFKQSGSYRTISRFANGTTFVFSDAVPDARSHSLKIFGVPGEKLVSGSPNTMDLVMNNAPVFIFKSPQSFYEFFTKVMAFPKEQAEAKEAYKKKFFVSSVVSFLPPKYNGVDLLKATNELTSSKPVELMDIDYYSGIAFNLGGQGGAGGRAVKYKLQSVLCDPNRETPDLSSIDRTKENHLQTAVQKFKEGGVPACWDLMVQFQVDPWRQPVEDTTIIWDHHEAPYKRLGRLTIRTQEVLVSPEDAGVDANLQKKLSSCEAMSFNPWRVPPEMRPLGDLAKMRGFTYVESLNRRRKMNLEKQIYSGPSLYQEPKGNELD